MSQLRSLRQQIAIPSTESLIAAGVSLALGAFVLNTFRRFLETRPAPVQPTNVDEKMPKTVVILGAGISGIATAHKLLKHTAPKLKGLKVILVSPSTHFYYNIAAVRGIIPGEIPDSALFYPIEPGFAKYPQGSFELVVGSAKSLDLPRNAVQVSVHGGTTTPEERTITYDQLVIATGSSIATDLPFKTVGDYEHTVDELHKLQRRVEAAKSIVVAGAGPTGVETTGELATRYGAAKKLTLVIDGEHALPTLMPSVGKTAEAELAKMGVELLRKTRVDAATEETAGGGSKLTLSDGRTLVADVFLPLYGVRPNTLFVPADLLDAKSKAVKVDKTLRALGHANVWAVGDVNDVEVKTAMRAESQTVHLHPNLEAVLLGKGDGALSEYKPGTTTMMLVPLGRNKGTGQVGSWKVFRLMVTFFKGKSLLVEKAPAIVEGKSLFQNKI